MVTRPALASRLAMVALPALVALLAACSANEAASLRDALPPDLDASVHDGAPSGAVDAPTSSDDGRATDLATAPMCRGNEGLSTLELCDAAGPPPTDAIEPVDNTAHDTPPSDTPASDAPVSDATADTTAPGCPPRTCCINLQQDGAESDIDCGGPYCPGCWPFWLCARDSDCRGGSCDPDTQRCRPTCTDGLLNGVETDIDCGGPCPACRPLRDCNTIADCTTRLCAFLDHGNHCFAAPTCANATLDGEETDVDCGGPYCNPCPSRHLCSTDADCRDHCLDGRCF